MSVCEFKIVLPPVPLLQDMTSVQDTIASRWEKWFSNSPLLSIPTSEDDPFLKDCILPETIQCTEKETFLRKAFAPTKNPLLNTAQVHVIMAFIDLINTTNDALALRVLLRDRLLCFCSEEYTNLIQKAEYAGDYFRLLLLYFNPALTFRFDNQFKGWEDTISTFIMDPASYLSPSQLWLLFEPLQTSPQRSVLWLMLWLVHVFCLHESIGTSFDQYLHEALKDVTMMPSTTMVTQLINSSQEAINDIFSILSNERPFSLPMHFSDIVGPVITTEHRYKKMVPHTLPTISSRYVVLDIRKDVAARNDFVNVVDGCVEATLFSSLSTNQTTQIRYIHVPYSSTHTEGNTYYAFCEPYNYPLIILADNAMEANVVALLLQKDHRLHVSIAQYDPSNKQDFPQLLDILLSSDYTSPTTSFKPPRGMFGGWTWWKGWATTSDNETSSSEFYRSASVEEERIIITEATTTKSSKTEEGHSKGYFDAIHSCLDKLVTEVNQVEVGATITSHLLTIVHSLLYTHSVVVIPEDEIQEGVSAIEAMHVSTSTEGKEENKGSQLRGPHLLILTESRCLLLEECCVDSTSEKAEQPTEDQTQIDSDTAIIASIVSNFLPVFNDNEPFQCDNYIAKLNIPLEDIQLINILINEDDSDQSKAQIIHIKDASQENIFLQVDYAIFIVNELMHRIGKVSSWIVCCDT